MKHFYFTIITSLFFSVFVFSQAKAQSTTKTPADAGAVGTWQTVRGSKKLEGLQYMKGSFDVLPKVKWKAALTSPNGGGEGEPVIGDVNGDGLNDVVMAEGSKLWVFNGTTGALIWSRTGVCNQTSVAIGDVNNDGNMDILSLNDKAYLLNGSNGATIWSWTPPPAPNTGGAIPFSTASYIGTCPNIGDLDNDGIPEAVILVNDGVYILNGSDGILKWKYATGNPNGVLGFNGSTPAIGDLNSDGFLDVVANLEDGQPGGNFGGIGGRLVALSGNSGALIWAIPGPTNFGLGSPLPAIGDVDGDCDEDVVINLGAVESLTGNTIWGNTVSGGSEYCSIVDLNDDGAAEIVTACGVYKGKDGSVIWQRIPCSNSGWFAPAPRIGDFNPASPGKEILHGGSYNINNPIVMYNGFTGALLWSYSMAAENHTVEGFSVGDVDNDGCVEIVIAPDCCNGSATVMVLDDLSGATNCGISQDALKATFTASKTNACVNSCINFTKRNCVGLNWIWHFPGGTPSVSTSQNPYVCFNTIGTYTVSLLVNFGSIVSPVYDTAYLPITILCNDLGVNMSPNVSICPGSCTTITASAINGTPPYNYTWSPGALTGSTINVCPVKSETYTLTVTDNMGATATETASVYVHPTLKIIGDTATICPGESIPLGVFSGITYSWNTGETTASIVVKPAATTTYSITTTNSDGCVLTASIKITVNDGHIPVIITGNTTICSGNSTTLSTSGGGTYLWSNGSNSSSINVSPSVNTSYSVTVTKGACSGSASIQVMVNPSPSPTISPLITQNGADLISSEPTGNQWYMDGLPIPGATNQIYTVTTNGDYYVVVMLGSCPSTPSYHIIITDAGMEEMERNYFFNIYPNPNNGIVLVKYIIPQNDKGEIKIYDLAGKLIEEYTLNSSSNTLSLNTNLDNGIYLYQVIVNDEVLKTNKLVVIKE